MPSKTGMNGTQFQPCSTNPNSVSSMASKTDGTHYIEPLSYSGSLDQAQQRLMEVLQAMERVTLIKQTPQYWYFTFQTALLKFTDDVEFYFPAKEKTIQMRSASRIGYSDWGVNRKRLEQVRERFESMPPTREAS